MFVIIYIILCIVCGFYAISRSQRFFYGFLVSFVLTPILGYILIKYLKKREY
jgi:hypothetical protein